MGLADMANAILGHHPGYLTLAAKLDCASFFSIPNTAWVQLPPAARWSANVQFLKAAIAQKDRFVFSHPPALARRGSSFFREIRFLASQGVRLAPLMDAYVP